MEQQATPPVSLNDAAATPDYPPGWDEFDDDPKPAAVDPPNDVGGFMGAVVHDAKLAVAAVNADKSVPIVASSGTAAVLPAAPSKKTKPAEQPGGFLRADGSEELSPQMERLVTAVFDPLDLEAEYRVLEQQLSIGQEGRTDYGSVLAALDTAEVYARRAHKLFIASKLEEKRFLLEREQVESALYRHGVDSLKESGDKVTIDAVKARYVELYGDEYRAGEERKTRVKLACDDMENLSYRWACRAADVRTMLETMRR
jgi:hypothetical protein